MLRFVLPKWINEFLHSVYEDNSEVFTQFIFFFAKQLEIFVSNKI